MKDQIRIISKNNPDSLEYSLGDIFTVDSTWYGGVNVTSKTGIPLNLDANEYEIIEQANKDTENKDTDNKGTDNKDTNNKKVTEKSMPKDIKFNDSRINVGDIVKHFKREWVDEATSEYLYKVLAFASHTETGERLVIYQGMYAPFKICARSYEMFMSKVDKDKYPDVKQEYRFEKYE